MHDSVLRILEAAEENCRFNGGDWAGWENAHHLLATYGEITLPEFWPESAISELENALTELKGHEASIRSVLTETGVEDLVHVECPDGEIFLYRTPWHAWKDKDNAESWLAVGRLAR
jgi:hypothetical protein